MWRVGKIEKWSHACARERGGTGDTKDNVLFLPRAVGRMVYNNLELMKCRLSPGTYTRLGEIPLALGNDRGLR